MKRKPSSHQRLIEALENISNRSPVGDPIFVLGYGSHIQLPRRAERHVELPADDPSINAAILLHGKDYFDLLTKDSVIVIGGRGSVGKSVLISDAMLGDGIEFFPLEETKGEIQKRLDALPSVIGTEHHTLSKSQMRKPHRHIYRLTGQETKGKHLFKYWACECGCEAPNEVFNIS